MTRNNKDFHVGKAALAASRAGYITPDQAADLDTTGHIRKHLDKTGYKESDATVDRVNKKVDNITYGGTPGKMWRTG